MLKQCELALDGVEYQSFNIDTLDIHFERLNTRFKSSYNLAILLLEKSIPMFTQDKKNFGFLFDMNDLFEDLELGKDDKMVKLKMKSIDLDFDGGYDEFICEIRYRVEEIK